MYINRLTYITSGATHKYTKYAPPPPNHYLRHLLSRHDQAVPHSQESSEPQSREVRGYLTGATLSFPKVFFVGMGSVCET